MCNQFMGKVVSPMALWIVSLVSLAVGLIVGVMVGAVIMNEV